MESAWDTATGDYTANKTIPTKKPSRLGERKNSQTLFAIKICICLKNVLIIERTHVRLKKKNKKWKDKNKKNNKFKRINHLLIG